MTIAEFLLRLRTIDKRGLTVRDILLLYYFMSHPGNSGADVCHALGIDHRSNIQLCLKRLFKAGFLEDRRAEFSKRVVGRLYTTPAGAAFWEEIKP